MPKKIPRKFFHYFFYFAIFSDQNSYFFDFSNQNIPKNFTLKIFMQNFKSEIIHLKNYSETRDFLHFLRRIKYDHSQLPNGPNGGSFFFYSKTSNFNSFPEPVIINVSIVLSNVRAVSEVTMDYSLEMFYRESWLDHRLTYDSAHFRNKSEFALHESYADFLWVSFLKIMKLHSFEFK
jgi:hypothetical protein